MCVYMKVTQIRTLRDEIITVAHSTIYIWGEYSYVFIHTNGRVCGH
jgi:hypothetical protein